MQESLFTHSELERPPLRIGLLVDSPDSLAWVFRTIVEHIQRSNFAHLELIVVNDTAASAPPPAPLSPFTRVQRLLTSPAYRSAVLWGLYARWDRRNGAGLDPTTPVPCADLFGNTPVLRVTPIAKRFVHRFPPEAITTIRDYRLDVLLRFGFNILRGDILTVASSGVWSYHHGDNDFYRGGPSHFWELVEGNPLSGVILQVLTEQLDAGQVLAKGIYATEPGLSLTRNRIRPYWGSSTFVIQKLRELYEHGPEHLAQNRIPNAPYQGGEPIYVAPTAGELLRWTVPLVARKTLHRISRQPMIDHWQLAVRVTGPPLRDTSHPPDTTGFRPIVSPPGRFYADPFLTGHSGQPWAFFEDYSYRTKLGRLSAAPVLSDGQLGIVVPVLEKPYHFSYPCLFEERNELFMIPESFANNSVDLYRCVEFPGRWELVRCLFQGLAVDTTVFRQKDRYWFFTSLLDPRANALQLWLFHSDRLDGDWTPHPQSPLSTDVRYSRCAGAVVQQDGRLFRVSQSSSGNYGRSFRFNEITTLNRTHYAEQPCASVEPFGPSCVGTHTYSHYGDIELIDTCTRMPSRKVLLP